MVGPLYQISLYLFDYENKIVYNYAMQRLLENIFSIITHANPFFVIFAIVLIGLMLLNSYKFLKYGGKFTKLISKLVYMLLYASVKAIVIVVLSIGEVCSFRNIHFACSLDTYINKHNIYKVLLYTLVSGINLVSKLVFLLLSPMRFTTRSGHYVEPVNDNHILYNDFLFQNPSLVLLN
ncbi:MAG: hypothetical protein LBF12_00045 [Christensenellaceae bacterium]|jgi:hypothetical protein|nr:hypothetical protein [Christensenellaceae bacterium]